jgi:4-amino-4-deoxy-L-arabinose transferase-like glycosyltransferase
LRVYDYSRLGLSHFDEGIYAISGLWPWTGRFEPSQPFYSPPAFPILVGLVNLIAGEPHDSAGIAVSLAFSTATIPLTWWIARTWWQPPVGIIAAWLIAVDGMQIAFARTGLTDATFTFGVLLSLHLIRRELSRKTDSFDGRRTPRPTAGSLSEPPPNRAVAEHAQQPLRRGASTVGILVAGLAVGFTWNVKYNGFLPLWLSLGLIVGPGWRSRVARLFGITFVAALCYLPWALLFHVEHGYDSLINHQRGYVAGLGAIPQHAIAAAVSVNWLTLVPTAMAIVGVGVAVAVRWNSFAVRPAVAAALLSLSGNAYVAWLVLAGAYLIWGGGGSTTLATTIEESIEPPRRARISEVWLLVWLTLLPAYYAFYLRLWLPTHAVFLLYAGAGLITLGRLLSRVLGRPTSRVFDALLTAAAAVIIYAAFARDGTTRLRPDSPSGYRGSAALVRREIESLGGLTVALVRPPLIYYLSLSATGFHRLRGSVEEAFLVRQAQSIVVDYALADADPRFRDLLEQEIKAAFETVIEIPSFPSDVARIDDSHGRIAGFPARPALPEISDYAIKVYHRRP